MQTTPSPFRQRCPMYVRMISEIGVPPINICSLLGLASWSSARWYIHASLSFSILMPSFLKTGVGKSSLINRAFGIEEAVRSPSYTSLHMADETISFSAFFITEEGRQILVNHSLHREAHNTSCMIVQGLNLGKTQTSLVWKSSSKHVRLVKSQISYIWSGAPILEGNENPSDWQPVSQVVFANTFGKVWPTGNGGGHAGGCGEEEPAPRPSWVKFTFRSSPQLLTSSSSLNLCIHKIRYAYRADRD